MARIVKDHNSRRREILAAAQHLFAQKGYEETSIQDLLTAIGIAKGTFYHYFDSKQALLEELVEQMATANLALVEAVVADELLSAVEKFQRIFVGINRWEVSQKQVILAAFATFYRPENLRLRHELVQVTTARAVPLLTAVVEQGIAEGSFATPYPREAAQIAYRLLQEMIEIVGHLIIGAQTTVPLDTHERLTDTIAAYQLAVARVLATPVEMLQIFEAQVIYDKWIETESRSS